ncbi:acyl-CoA N-acyltransferase [Mollisia scopiformis]|uniref:Acyl-CoA N-acyltransferase n=1 Tax=Mollisia scopiformis TaxID=149040 RepID=A0A132B6K4_MOLSC|nr:acyl-CoA N-acyltransferase [Mollisia scopiformis]KUJ07883.1 acyl-CoA N-acyltransferase [Mollisia scopiformis]
MPTTSTATFTALFQTPNLIYRPLTTQIAHKQFIHTILSTQPTTWAQSTMRLLKPQTDADIEKYVERLAGSLLAVMIHKKKMQPTEEKNAESDEVPIGYLILSNDPLSAHHRCCSLGIVISDEYQNRGYGSEAINWSLNWAFDVAGLHHVGLGCYSFNEGGLKLYPRLGFKEEGRNREVYWYGGRWWDGVMFSMLEDEWRSMRQAE